MLNVAIVKKPAPGDHKSNFYNLLLFFYYYHTRNNKLKNQSFIKSRNNCSYFSKDIKHNSKAFFFYYEAKSENIRTYIIVIHI